MHTLPLFAHSQTLAMLTVIALYLVLCSALGVALSRRWL